MEVLQYISAGSTKAGQKVRFPKKKTWWEVIKIEEGITIVKSKEETCRLSKDVKLLQKPFENL